MNIVKNIEYVRLGQAKAGHRACANSLSQRANDELPELGTEPLDGEWSRNTIQESPLPKGLEPLGKRRKEFDGRRRPARAERTGVSESLGRGEGEARFITEPPVISARGENSVVYIFLNTAGENPASSLPAPWDRQSSSCPPRHTHQTGRRRYFDFFTE
jgi:hypothetical protein